MREGQQAGSPFAGEADFAIATRSLARAAEDLVRATEGPALAWEGATVTTNFQPIYCVRRQSCLGFEALVRAEDIDGNPIASEQFFDRHHHGSRTLLDWACRALHLRTYATVDPGDRTLFINVHPEAAVRDARRGRDLAELIRYYGLAPKRVCIEILEQQCSDEGLLREAVEGYRALGMSIAMDDFGAESSNFDRLISLKPDLVKIDKSILAGALGNDKANRVLPSMIELLHEFEVRVAVEGIESRAGAAAALDARADYLQGYFFGHPASRLDAESGGLERLDRLLHAPNLAAA
ncbi:MAG TPA: EAL domain-containing protein [Usitatibacter sp.]|nr:EAL domain-containing protein [Usitatibacter sp.]